MDKSHISDQISVLNINECAPNRLLNTIMFEIDAPQYKVPRGVASG